MAGSQPTLAGFNWFIVNVMGISTTILPADSAVIPFCLGYAVDIVNPAIQQMAPSCGPPIAGVPAISLYVTAVYNLAGDFLINFAQDQPDAPPVKGSKPPLPFFAYSRKQWNINGFVSGVIQTAADETTSESMVVQEAAKNFTLQDLQNLKTPYGRTYLGIAQTYGPSTWGMS
jgi:hypothetical protein